MLQDENVKVTSALVDHPPVVPAFAYRFDAADRSIVISGDTAASDRLVGSPRAPTCWFTRRCSFRASIASWRACRMRRRSRRASCLITRGPKMQVASHETAGVRMLVLSHLVPADDPQVTEQMWIDAARTQFDGKIVVGKDLLEI